MSVDHAQETYAQENASARRAEAEGESTYISETGSAKGAEVEAVGMARAMSYKAQVRELGQVPTALVDAVTALAEKGVKFVPEVLVSGNSGSIDGLAGVLTKLFSQGVLGQPHGAVKGGAGSKPTSTP